MIAHFSLHGSFDAQAFYDALDLVLVRCLIDLVLNAKLDNDFNI